MRILFYPYDCVPFHGNTLDEKPLGGVETAVIRLATALDALGHEVYVITLLKNATSIGPRYLSAEEAWKLPEFDLMVAVRSWEAFWQPFKAKRKFLWIGDNAESHHTIGIGDPRVMRLFDGLLCVSEWHRHSMCSSSGYPSKLSHVLRNGINLLDFAGHEERHRKRLIYTSKPSRGLIHLPQIFLELKKKHPDLELHIFSNASLYDMKWPPEVGVDVPHYVFLEMIRKMPGCIVHGTVLQKQLAREFMKSAIFAYPSHFLETSCISVMEAQAAGCVVVASDLGALPETTGNAGIIIPGSPLDEGFTEKYRTALDTLLSDDLYFQTLSQKALERSQQTDWKNRALELIKLYDASF